MSGNTPKSLRRGFRGGQPVFCSEPALRLCFAKKPTLMEKRGGVCVCVSPACPPALLKRPTAPPCPGFTATLSRESSPPAPHRPVGAAGPRAAPLAGALRSPGGAAERVLLPAPLPPTPTKPLWPCEGDKSPFPAFPRFSPSARPREGAAGGEAALGPRCPLGPGGSADLTLPRCRAARK